MLLLPSQGHTRPARWPSPGDHPHSAPLNISPLQTNLEGLFTSPTSAPNSDTAQCSWMHLWSEEMALPVPQPRETTAPALLQCFQQFLGPCARGKGLDRQEYPSAHAYTPGLSWATPGTCPCCSHTTLPPSSAAFFMDQVLGHSFRIHSPVLWGQVPSGHRQKTRKFGEEPREGLGLEGGVLNGSGPGSP